MLVPYLSTLLAIHVLSFIAWMAGLLYLPRLFIYHLEFQVGEKPYDVFCRMERRLLTIILRPAILLTFLSGILLAYGKNLWASPWFHTKLCLVFLLAGCHGYFARMARQYQQGIFPRHSRKMLLFLNELPFLIAIAIVFLVFLKPR